MPPAAARRLPAPPCLIWAIDLDLVIEDEEEAGFSA